MQPFDILILLIFSYKTKSQSSINRTTFYFLYNGKEHITSDPQHVYGKNLDKIVIDLVSTCYINLVIVDHDLTKKVSIQEYRNKNLNPFTSCLQLEDRKTYECNAVSRIIVLEGEGEIKELRILGNETKLENYVGCYQISTSGTEGKSSNLKDCESMCSSHFYAVNSEENCTCLWDLKKAAQVHLKLCNESCPAGRFEICGSKEYFSIYSKKSTQMNRRTASWSCIFDQTCEKCVGGRRGFNCEIIDCSVGSGNCIDMWCQNTTIWRDVVFAVCSCIKGFYREVNLTCADINECQTVRPCLSENYECVNYFGSYQCVCPSKGFQQTSETSCDDIDECLGNNVCGDFMVCINKRGSYSCACKSGFHEVKSICTDVDECIRKDICILEKFCVNSIGNYTCNCTDGYSNVDSQTCMEDDPGWDPRSDRRKRPYQIYFLFASITILLLFGIGASLYYTRKRLMLSSTHESSQASSATVTRVAHK